ncbi:LD-carboxypeptidase [Sphingomicrobium sp. XHP0239]|uniref:LD-carboxypeptidase n=1 Tax=Sphingomicrobium maritimum TaxID=3133972 RepID=UPI0031CCC29A
MRIAIVAPSCPLDPAAVPMIAARAAAAGVAVDVHPQCFSRAGHFAGSDAERLAAILELMANDAVDAVWCARGGYGSNRIAEAVAAQLPAGARDKAVMGFSDAGFLLSALHREGVGVAHGPMAQDALRIGGIEAIDRAIAWLARQERSALEADLTSDRPTLAFNLEVLVSMLGTPIAPRLAGAELLIEEVAEHLYAIDRAMFMLTGQSERPASLRLGRVSDVPHNDPDFGEEAEAIVARWCERAGIDYRGRADIGHDAANKVVPFSSR